jgi:hypothetical protein
MSSAATPIKQVITITERGLRASNMALLRFVADSAESELIQ